MRIAGKISHIEDSLGIHHSINLLHTSPKYGAQFLTKTGQCLGNVGLILPFFPGLSELGRRVGLHSRNEDMEMGRPPPLLGKIPILYCFS